jgi:hypothetical protein
MGNRPSKHHSLERTDNSKGYSKENCVWATMKSQANNKRSNRIITYDGISQTLQQWANETGIKADTIARRLKWNWPIKEVLTLQPCKSRRLKNRIVATSIATREQKTTP